MTDHNDYVERGRRIIVRGPGRCTECSFYVALQGHREGCSRTAPIQPGEADFGVYQGSNFIEAIEQIKAAERETERQWKAFTAPTHKPIGEGSAYALGALRGEAEIVAGTPAGARNHQLNKSAYKLKIKFVDKGLLTEDEVEAALLDAAVACGHVKDDGEAMALGTIKSGLRGKRP